MKKIITVLLLSVFLSNCGSDDSGGSSLKPTSMSASSGGTTDLRTFTYDNKDRLQSMTSDGDAINFTYNNKNKVDKITIGTDFYQFAYNSSNQLISVTDQDGDVTAVTPLGNNSYTIEGTTVALDANGDFTAFSNVTFTHGSTKGAFANVKAFDALALYFADEASYIYAAKKRVTNIGSNGSQFAFTYTEGEKGLPATATLNSGTATTIIYTYAE
jgi:YD repeat-containing protein